MKKVLIIIAISLFSMYSYGQLNKGGWIGSFQGSGGAVKYNDYKSSSLKLQPSVMYLISNNLALGLNVSTSFESYKLPSVNDIRYNQRSFALETGPVLRKYFGSYKLKPYAELGIGWNYSQSKSTNYEYLWNDHRLYVKPALGLSYWISNNVSIDMNVNYDINAGHSLFRYDDWRLNIGISVKLGD